MIRRKQTCRSDQQSVMKLKGISYVIYLSYGGLYCPVTTAPSYSVQSPFCMCLDSNTCLAAVNTNAKQRPRQDSATIQPRQLSTTSPCCRPHSVEFKGSVAFPVLYPACQLVNMHAKEVGCGVHGLRAAICSCE